MSNDYPSLLKPRELNEGMLRGLDYFLAEAGKRGIKVPSWGARWPPFLPVCAPRPCAQLAGSAARRDACRRCCRSIRGAAAAHAAVECSVLLGCRSSCPSPPTGHLQEGWTPLPISPVREEGGGVLLEL